MLITLKLDSFHRKLSSYKYRIDTLTFSEKIRCFFNDYYSIYFGLSTLRVPNNVDDDFLYFCHKNWLSLFVCFHQRLT